MEKYAIEGTLYKRTLPQEGDVTGIFGRTPGTLRVTGEARRRKIGVA
jgi:hypothetical protein